MSTDETEVIGPIDRPVPVDPVEPVDPVDPDDEVTEPFPGILERLGAWWTVTLDRFARDPGKAVEAALSFVAVVLATGLVLTVLHPSQFFSGTTPTGGDMGSHVWGPRYLVDHLLPHFRLSGWTPDWYSGFPAYQFYMVVPSLMVVVLFVGLPWYLAIPALVGCAALGLAGWARERLYPYRFVLAGLAGFLAVLVVPVSYNQSFKLVTGMGLLGLPTACWLLAKLSDLPFPAPPLFAGASLLFIFNQQPFYNDTGNIIGGNFQSTMAGEFAFSISILFAVLYLGVAVRGLRNGRHRALAALLFAIAGLCHLIPAFFVLGATGALFLLHPDRARLKWLATMVPVAGLLTAFWVLPFWARRDYVNDMGWEKLPVPTAEQTSAWYYLWPDGLFWVFVMAAVGVVLSIILRRNLGLVLGIVWLAVSVAFVKLPQDRLWNARLLPFAYLCTALLSALALAELIHLAATAAAGDARRPMRAVTVVAGSLALLGALLYVVLPLTGIMDNLVEREPYTDVATNTTKTRSELKLLSMFRTNEDNPASGWSNFNYQGLESKPAYPPGCTEPDSAVPCTTGGFPEFKRLVQTMAGIGKDDRYGCGRAFWEYDGTRLNGYGTPMAPMMLPYFTDGCIGSQEGLYFESSTTVPYHFLMQSELSKQGSAPQRDLVYPGFDIDAGVRHMQLLGVRYYLASTTEAVNGASLNPDLHEIAVTGPWHVYEVADSDTVAPLECEPVVAEGMGESQDEWLPTASAWFLDPEALDTPLADGGPSTWKRVPVRPVPEESRRAAIWARGQLGFGSEAIDKVPDLPCRKLPKNKVSNIEMGRDTMSFDVEKTGVPVLVKTSYFPNWEVDGADGPYRVTPNLMVVVPHSKHVEFHYQRTPIDLLGMGLTLLGLVGLVWLARSPAIELPQQRPSRMSLWLDEVITIPPMEKQPRRRARAEVPDEAWIDAPLEPDESVEPVAPVEPVEPVDPVQPDDGTSEPPA